MSNVLFPIRRVDGGLLTAGLTELPTNPIFNSLTVSGPTLDINGIEYTWPVADGVPGQLLTTDGNNPATLSFTNPSAPNPISHIRQDADTNTSVEVDLPGTGLDDTIRYTTAGTEVHTITETTTQIKNNFTHGESVSTTLTTIGSPLNYTPNFGPIHIIRDSYIYFVADTDLVIVDVSTTPSIISTTNFGFVEPTSIKLFDNYAYISEGDSATATNSYIINILDPTTPTLAGTFDQIDSRTSAIQGSYLYSVDTSIVPGGGIPTTNLRVINLSTPTTPESVSYTIIAGDPRVDSIMVRDNYLYLTTYLSGNQTLQSYDITDPSSPSLVDTLVLNTVATDYAYTSLTTSGNYLYIQSVNKGAAAVSHGIVSIDINNPASLVVANTYALSSSINGTAFHNNTMTTRGKFLYFVEPVDSVLTILNIENPAAMTLHTTIPLTSPLSISIDGRYLYIVETPQSTLTVYNYKSALYQHLDTGSLYANDTNVNGSMHCSMNLYVTKGMQVDNGLNSQRKASVFGNVNIEGTVTHNSGVLTRSFRQLTGASPITTLDNDYIINTNHTGTATINLLSIASGETGVEYQIIKENANQVDIVANGADLIWNGAADVGTLSLTGPVNERLVLFCNGVKWIRIN